MVFISLLSFSIFSSHGDAAACMSKRSQARRFYVDRAATRKRPMLGKIENASQFFEKISAKPEIMEYTLLNNEHDCRKFKITSDSITENGKTHIIFRDIDLIKDLILKDAKRMNVDGTFRVVPSKCGTQMLTIMLSYDGPVS